MSEQSASASSSGSPAVPADRGAPTLPISAASTAEAERLARLELSLLTEPGHPRLAELVSVHGAVEIRERLRSGDLPSPPAWRKGWQRGIDARAERLLESTDGSSRRWVCPGDDEWPDQLDDLVHVEALQERGGAPLGLWVRGRRPLRSLGCAVAVVGARACTEYGARLASDIGAGCADRDIPVVSGAAFGIDAAAHRGALAVSGVTVAVLACGVDLAYPSGHESMLERIADTGLVVSELCPGTRPSRVRFLARNRLIAGLTAGVVVVEAARRSGALNTLNWASRLGRPTMGVPGPVTSAASAGVHQVLRDGGAVVVTGAEEVAEVVSPLGSATVEWIPGERRLTDGLSAPALAVLEAVPPRRARDTEAIAADAQVEPEIASTVLGRLLCAGWVERTGAGWKLSERASRALRHAH